MEQLLIHLTLETIISLAILAATNILSSRSNTDRENSSPFECGFDPNNSARLPFSLRFFLLAVIFLVFDVEIAILIPVILIINWSISHHLVLSTTIFLIILIFGLAHEWNEGSLDWTI